MEALEVLYALHMSDGFVYVDEASVSKEVMEHLSGIVVFESGKAYWDL